MANFFLNLLKLGASLVLAVYAWFVPKDTNDVASAPQNFERAEFEQFIPARLNKWLNRLEEHISGRDLTAEMQVELGSVSSLAQSLVDDEAERDGTRR